MSVMSLICAVTLATGVVDTNATPRARMSPRVVVPEATSIAVDLALDKPVEEVSVVESSSILALDVPADEVVPVDVVLPSIFPAETNLPTKVRVPDVIATMLASATGIQVQSAIAQSLAMAVESNLPNVLSAVYAKMMQVTVPGISQVDLVKARLEWYEKLVAIPSSKAWWILQVAKQRAEQGQSVEDLKKLFD